MYLLVTDLHCDTEKANRINYFGEVVNSMQDIINIADSYRKQGYSPRLILLGDVFDGGIANPSDAMQLMEVFHYFCSMFDKTWSVVGNHELSFITNNPFWFLVTTIEDDELSRVKKLIQPHGLTQCITVPSTIVDGDTTFYFNHYGIPPHVPQATGTRIGLFHQNVGSNDICKMWGTFDNVEDAAYIQGYNYSFFGHTHLAKGRYWLNKEHTCQGIWLGTIGRTKADEVIDDSLMVDIPAIIIEDEKFQRIEYPQIKLQSRLECIDELKLQAAKQSRAVVEERKRISEVNYTGEGLYDSLRISLADGPLEFILSFMDASWDEIRSQYKETLEHLPEGDTENGTNSSTVE